MMTMEDDHHEFFELIQKFRSLNLLATLPLPRQDYMVLYAVDCLQKEHPNSCTVSMITKKMRVPQPAVSRTLRSLENGGYLSLPLRPPEYLCIIDRCRKDCRAGSRSDAHSLP